MRRRGFAVWAMVMAMVAVRAQAQETPPSPEACVPITSNALRLACYDRAMDRKEQAATDTGKTSPRQTPAHKPRHARQRTRNSFFHHDQKRESQTDTTTSHANRRSATSPPTSLLDSRWELSRQSKLGTFNIRGYKPVYLLPVFYTSRVNNRPRTPSPDNVAQFSRQLDSLEAMFQISFKTKLVQGMFAGKGDLWFGYTQTSHWQVYNGDISRPFRATNYQPEAMLVFNTDYHLAGWDGRMLGIGVVHQSNGRSDPLSRSWNRIIADIAFERPGWTIMFRPWLRIHEPRRKDDNPDIADYMGHGQVQIVHETAGGDEFGLMVRHVLRHGKRSHGAIRLTWSFPIHAKLRGYMQVFHGYGESLIDYNHSATYFGVGVSLLGWY